MMHFIKKINKLIAILISFLMIVQNVVYATQDFPVQIESAAFIPPSPNFLPSDEQHAFAPPIEGVSPVLANTETDLNEALEAAADQDWNIFYDYYNTYTNQDVRDIFYNAFMYEYSEQFLEYMEEYFPDDPMLDSWKASMVIYLNNQLSALNNYSANVILTENYGNRYQVSIAIIKAMKQLAELNDEPIDVGTYLKADKEAKVAANIWTALNANPNADPAVIIEAESGSASDDDENSGGNATCNYDTSLNAQPQNSAIGSPVYSVDPATLNIFLKDIPLRYQPRIGPEVKIRLVYSLNRDENSVGSVGRKWHINFDSKFIYDNSNNKWHSISPEGRTDIYELDDFDVEIGCTVGVIKRDVLNPTSYKPRKAIFFGVDEYNINEIHVIGRDYSVLVYKNIDSGLEYRLVEKRDSSGNAIIYNRDSSGKIQNITDACGNVTVIYWETGGSQIQSIVDPVGHSVDFTYNSYSVITTITDAAGFPTVFTYRNGKNAIYSFKIENKEPTYFSLEGTANSDVINTIRITDPLQNVEIYQWSSNFSRTRNKNNFWHKYVRDYDCAYLSPDNERVYSAKQSILDYWLYSEVPYDNISDDNFKLNNIKMFFASEKNLVDNQTSNYDIMQLMLFDKPEGGMYDTENPEGQIEIPYVKAEKINLTVEGDIYKTFDPDDDSKFTQYTYNDIGQVTHIKLPDNTIWEYQYTDLKKLEKIVPPAPDNSYDNWTYRYSYDELGRITKAEALIKQGYELIPPSLDYYLQLYGSYGYQYYDYAYINYQYSLYYYESQGLLADIKELYSINYDANNNQEIIYPDNGKNQIDFDYCGRVDTIIRTADGQNPYTTSYEYDGLGRITKVTYPDGTSTDIDMGLKGPTKITDRDDKITQYEYNNIFQKEKIIRNDGGEIEFNYSGLRLTEIEDAENKITFFDYDGGRFLGQKYPGCNWQSIAYDWLTRIVATTNESGQVITFDYDNAGKLIKKNVNDDESIVEYSYNTNGKIETLIDSVGTHIYDYNDRGILYSDTFTANGDAALSYTITYTYDNIGNRKTMTVAPEGETPHTIEYEYDESTLALKSVTDNAISPGEKTTQYSYDNLGRLQSTLYANDAKQEYSYNSNMRLENLIIKDGLGSEIKSYSYSYSPGGIITFLNESGSGYNEYHYDDLNQITESWPAAGWLYTDYDANGNREYFDTGEGYLDTYEYGEDNRLISYEKDGEPFDFTYDARGNRKSQTSQGGPTVNYTYDTENRMTSCQIEGSSSSATYIYDSFGRKVKRVDNTGTTCYYIYDGMDCIYEKDVEPIGMLNPPIISRWVLRGLGVAPGVGNIVALQNKTVTINMDDPFNPITTETITTDYYHSNHRGDTVFTSDENGNKKAELRYDAFGKTAYELNADDVKYRFSSKEWDSDAQLYYYGFRWYDPEHGIWTTKDPIGIQAGDLNVYRMVFNNPVYFIDYYGLSILGKAWNGANTAIGLAWGGVGMLAGADVSIGNNAIQFENHPLMFGAITLGNTISYASCFGPEKRPRSMSGVSVGEHEQQHTIQGEILGPLYLPANIIGGIAGLISGGEWHASANFMERGLESMPPKPW